MNTLFEKFDGIANWVGRDLIEQDWLYLLTEQDKADIDAGLSAFLEFRLPMEAVSKENFPLAGFGAYLSQLSARWHETRGLVLIRGLDVDAYSETDLETIFYAIGSYLGTPISQNAKGHLLGHVRSDGKRVVDRDSVRGYHTNTRLRYHCDYSDIVGLLCVRTAQAGGISRVLSAAAVYNAFLKKAPDLMNELFKNYHLDRREEQIDDEAQYGLSPIFAQIGGVLSARYMGGDIRNAHNRLDIPALSASQNEALEVLEEIMSDPMFALDMSFADGDMQFLDNYTVFHARTEYVDYPAPERWRHLLRLWIRLDDRRPIPEEFDAASRYGRLCLSVAELADLG